MIQNACLLSGKRKREHSICRYRFVLKRPVSDVHSNKVCASFKLFIELFGRPCFTCQHNFASAILAPLYMVHDPNLLNGGVCRMADPIM